MCASITFSHGTEAYDAGIGGLAAAYMLSRTGHRVRVVERYGLDATGGGQRIPPNLSKILRQWVGEDELRKVTSRCIGTPFYKSKSALCPDRCDVD